MKSIKFLSLVFIGLALPMFLISCKNEPSAECVALETADKQLKADIKLYESTWDEVINKGKLDLINETNFDKNITLVSKPGNIVGIEAFKNYYKNYIVGFSNVKFSIINVFGHGDTIVKHWNFKGKHTGVFFGIPPTNKEVDVNGVTLVKMKDGKILQEEDFTDNLEFMQQLELIPKP